jgi:hypothetical protein
MYLNVLHLAILGEAAEGPYLPDVDDAHDVAAVDELVATGYLVANEDEFALYGYEMTDDGEAAYEYAVAG